MFEVPKDLFVVVSGPSGVGKSTLLQGLLAADLSDIHAKIIMPKLVTTRDPRVSDSANETLCISNQAFQDAVADGKFISTYQVHGHQYGFLASDVLRERNPYDRDPVVYIQTSPTNAGVSLREKLSTTHDVKIFRLMASPEAIHQRLIGRQDQLPASELQLRQQSAFKATPEGIDYQINAEQSPSAILETVVRQIKDLLVPKVPNTELQLTQQELEVLQTVADVCKSDGTNLCIYAGMAAHIYGSTRTPTDLDLLIDKSDLEPLRKKLPFDGMVVTEKAISIGRLDIRKCPMRIGDREKGQLWQFDNAARKKQIVVNLGGVLMNVMAPEDVVLAKSCLQRGADVGKFDLYDVQNIITNFGAGLDKDYIAQKARQANVLEMSSACLARFGFHVVDREEMTASCSRSDTAPAALPKLKPRALDA